MHPATPRTTTETAGEILRHTRRSLNHLHRSINNNSQTTPEDPHLIHWHYAEFGDNNFKIHGETLFYIFILFSIILFITLLLLYARWFFRFRHPSTAAAAAAAAAGGGGVPSTTVSLQHIVIQLPNRALGHQRQASGLEPSVINSLPIILHQQSKGDEFSECCICLGGFEDGDKVKVLPDCKHEYHTECVDRWLIAHSSCPLCRIAIRVDPNPMAV